MRYRIRTTDKGVPDYETKSSYSIRVAVSDGSLSYEQKFTIAVTDEDDPPTDIALQSDFQEKAYNHVIKISSFGVRKAGSQAEASTVDYLMKCLGQSGIKATDTKRIVFRSNILLFLHYYRIKKNWYSMNNNSLIYNKQPITPL